MNFSTPFGVAKQRMKQKIYEQIYKSIRQAQQEREAKEASVTECAVHVTHERSAAASFNDER